MDALKADGAKAPAAQTQVDTTSAAVLMYTSGTTGNPKGVLISHKAPPRTPTLTLTLTLTELLSQRISQRISQRAAPTQKAAPSRRPPPFARGCEPKCPSCACACNPMRLRLQPHAPAPATPCACACTPTMCPSLQPHAPGDPLVDGGHHVAHLGLRA
jgi:acyl-CoA synthetase (AMP-forming)/AMP-acid ligase II